MYLETGNAQSTEGPIHTLQIPTNVENVYKLAMYVVLTQGLNETILPTQTSVSASLVYMVCDGHLYPNLNETIKFACTKWGAKNLYDNLASLKWT